MLLVVMGNIVVFPTVEVLRKTTINKTLGYLYSKYQKQTILGNVRRKGISDSFDPRNKIYYVCEFPFKAEDIRVSMGIGRKTIIPGRLPSIFKPKDLVIKPSRKSPRKRLSPLIEESSSEVSSNQNQTNMMILIFLVHRIMKMWQKANQV